MRKRDKLSERLRSKEIELDLLEDKIKSKKVEMDNKGNYGVAFVVFESQRAVKMFIDEFDRIKDT